MPANTFVGKPNAMMMCVLKLLIVAYLTDPLDRFKVCSLLHSLGWKTHLLDLRLHHNGARSVIPFSHFGVGIDSDL